MGRPERDAFRIMAMQTLGSGLSAAEHDADSLSVNEALLSIFQRIGASEDSILVVQGNMACTYHYLGRFEETMRIRRELYSRTLKLKGREHRDTLVEARNLATALNELKLFKEAKTLMRKWIPVARRVLGEDNEFTLKTRWNYAQSLYGDNGATLDDLREAVATLEEIARISRRVLGNSHPVTGGIEGSLKRSRSTLRARETQSRSA